jgi:O-antigen/teichoic acid export membrane protein
VLDQVVYAATNFLTMVALARLLNVVDLGVFVLAFSLQIISITLQSINLGPMRIAGATIELANQRRYYSSQLNSIVFCATLIYVSLLSVIMIFDLLMWHVAIALCTYVASAQIYEFFRVKNMTLLRFGRLLFQDFTMLSSRIVFLALVWWTSSGTIFIALNALVAAYLISSLLEVFRDRSVLSLSLSRGALGANFEQGKWWVLEGLGAASLPQFVNFLVASLLGSQAVAGLGAVQSLVNAPGAIGLGIANMMIPVARQQLSQQGFPAWRNVLLLSGTLICLAQWSLLATIYVIGETLLIWLYGASYERFADLLPIGCLQYMMVAAGLACSVAYRTAQRTNFIFGSYGCAGLVAIAASPLLVGMLGLKGAALALALYHSLWLIGLAIGLPAAVSAAARQAKIQRTTER